jgi:hypothetical protein
MGRFMSPDPSQLMYANPANPQSFNLYSYGQNNPLTNIDPTGLDCVTDNGDGTVGTNTGDCENGSNGGDANKEYYIDCDGCTSNSTGATLDAATGSLYLTDANGNGIAGTTVQGFADPTGVSTSASTSALTGNMSISGYGASGGMFIPGVNAALFPQLRARPSATALFFMSAGCYAGQDPDNMIPAGASGAPQDSSDSTEQTQGQRNLNGPSAPKPFVPSNNNLYEHQRNMPAGGGAALNPGGSANAADDAANRATYAANLARCLGNVSAFSY